MLADQVLVERVVHHHAVGVTPAARSPTHAQRVEGVEGVRPQLDASADFADFSGLLQHRDSGSRAGLSCRRRQPAGCRRLPPARCPGRVCTPHRSPRQHAYHQHADDQCNVRIRCSRSRGKPSADVRFRPGHSCRRRFGGDSCRETETSAYRRWYRRCGRWAPRPAGPAHAAPSSTLDHRDRPAEAAMHAARPDRASALTGPARRCWPLGRRCCSSSASALPGPTTTVAPCDPRRLKPGESLPGRPAPRWGVRAHRCNQPRHEARRCAAEGVRGCPGSGRWRSGACGASKAVQVSRRGQPGRAPVDARVIHRRRGGG